MKKIHTIDLDESNLPITLTPNETNCQLIEPINQSDENTEQIPNYSFNTTVQAPLILNKMNENDQSTKPYADIHLSINIFLPKKTKPNSVSHKKFSRLIFLKFLV